ncbi:MAG: hypothetical protein AAGJ82_11710 [Bacteroidota bacterium]
MKSLVLTLFTFSLLLGLTPLTYAQDTAPQPEDLARLVGEWKGTLTYRNYGDGKFYDVASTLSITTGSDAYEVQADKQFPSEPNKGGIYKIAIAEDGSEFNGGEVISRKVLEDGTVEIITEQKGRDNRKRCTIRFTYLIGDDSFIDRKEVLYRKQTEWLRRNEFKYERV